MTDMIGISGGSPVIPGTWQNPNTGDVVVVRDQSFGSDGLMYINTNDGRVLDFNQFSQYLQISDTEMPASEIRKIQGKPLVDETPYAPNPQPVNNSMLEGLLPEDAALIAGKPNNIFHPTQNDDTLLAESNNYQIIKKAFKDKVDAPDINLVWSAFPFRQITLLTEIMDIPIEDIAEYVYKEYVNNKDIMIEKIKESIEAQIHDVIANP